MASSGKPKTTRAKLQREAVLRERRLDKAARKEIRKRAQNDPTPGDGFDPWALETGREAPETDPDASAADRDALETDRDASATGREAPETSRDTPEFGEDASAAPTAR